jgi:hypothetical protein
LKQHFFSPIQSASEEHSSGRPQSELVLIIFGHTPSFLSFRHTGLKQKYIIWLPIDVSSVVEFLRWWVLKRKVFGQETTCHHGKIFKKFLRVMTVCQKLGLILESKVVQKWSLEQNKYGLLNWYS